MLHRVHNFIYQLHCDTRYRPLSLRECSLQGAQSNPRLLCGYTGEELRTKCKSVVAPDWLKACPPYRSNSRQNDRVQHGGVRQVVLREVVLEIVVIIRWLSMDTITFSAAYDAMTDSSLLINPARGTAVR